MSGKTEAKYGKEQGYESHRFGPRVSGFRGNWVPYDAQIAIIHDSIWMGAAGKPLGSRKWEQLCEYYAISCGDGYRRSGPNGKFVMAAEFCRSIGWKFTL
jgi:hypothetical protein